MRGFPSQNALTTFRVAPELFLRRINIREIQDQSDISLTTSS